MNPGAHPPYGSAVIFANPIHCGGGTDDTNIDFMGMPASHPES
jgi:hypothetical protein